MVKKMVCSGALLAALMLLFAGLASAQDLSQIKPTATIGEQILVRPMPGVLKSPFRLLPKGGPLVPAYCSPCLFYGGDGDPSNPLADGLWDNNSSTFGISGVVYSPFSVPEKTAKCGGICDWAVTGLFANIEYSPFPPTIDSVNWSVVTGVAAGGIPATTTVICSGTDPVPVLIDTGRLYFGTYEEFATVVSVSGCPALEGAKKGGSATYWETVTPNTGATGIFQLAYESNIPDSPPPNAVGLPEPLLNSFFFAPSFGDYTFAPAQNLGPYYIFSAGVEGTLVK